VYGVSVGEPEEKRPLGRPRHTWEDTIKMDVQEMKWGNGLASSDSRYEQVAGVY
jgi:hypothetical protein